MIDVVLLPAPTIFESCDDKYTYERLFSPLKLKLVKPTFSRLSARMLPHSVIFRNAGDMLDSGIAGHCPGIMTVPPPTTLGVIISYGVCTGATVFP